MQPARLRVLPGVMWYADVDYYRITSKGADSAERFAASISALERVGAGLSMGLQRWEDFKWMGFRGQRLGSLSFGTNGRDRWLYQGSGLSAGPLFNAGIPHDNCSRLDLQVTIWYDKPRPNLIKAVAAGAAAARVGARGRAWKVRLIDGQGDGNTAYIGARGKKAKFLRAYEKEAEAPGIDGWRNAYRFEAELTDEHARLAEASLFDLGVSANTVAALVRGYFAERGVALPEQLGSVVIAPEKLPRDEGNVERRLRWLRSQVSPAIDKLIADGVSLSLISEALGFTDTQQWERRQWL